MSQRRLILILPVISVLFCISCSNPDIDEGEVNKLRPSLNKNTNIKIDPNANVAEDNETELSSLIKLPFEPIENLYREDKVSKNPNSNRVPGPDERKLTAVLKFSEEDTKKLTKKLEDQGQPFEAKVEAETWFPAELIAKSQTSADESIKGVGYSADLFLKSPFYSGSLTRISETDYFVLILQTQRAS